MTDTKARSGKRSNLFPGLEKRFARLEQQLATAQRELACKNAIIKELDRAINSLRKQLKAKQNG
jgi:capsule polysaccharide export protein KpsE/RkpR